jgi:hypothetical protein
MLAYFDSPFAVLESAKSIYSVISPVAVVIEMYSQLGISVIDNLSAIPSLETPDPCFFA